MASSPRSTLVPVRKATHARLASLKGSQTFDQLIVALLDAAPPALPLADGRPRPGPPPRKEADDRRTPEKQLLLRRLAREAWAASRASGRLVERGPRLFDWRPPGSPGAVMDVEWPERRGFLA